MPQLIWSQRARRDLSELYDFLQPHSDLAGRRALQTIREGVNLLLQFPEAGRPVEDSLDVRELPIAFGASGYLVRYRFADDVVVIAAIRHMRQAGY
ncbi:type II toxin-antitoxin system RelE/ParE family toxin [Devosia sp.]|uniref:type II toxin-antitoxin system RelE/ParE family toxin n=1 Tax=Devosia sp. TaxID=1871048 RepID=UPI003BAD41ED